jgi:photosystem II stability/assembly factor-like uncharacterized protein
MNPSLHVRLAILSAAFVSSIASASEHTRQFVCERDTIAGRCVVAIAPNDGPDISIADARFAPDAALRSRSRASSVVAPATTALWQPMSVPAGVYIRAISMGTPQVGFAAGEQGVVLKTTDGGSTWTTIANVGFPYYWYGCQAFNANTVVISGFQNQSGAGVLRWSDDGGAHWSADVSLAGPASGVKWLDRVKFIDANHGIVENSWSGGVDFTSNGGRNPGDWTFSQPSPNWYNGTFTYLADGRVWMSGYDFEFSASSTASWTSFSGTSAVFDGPNSIHQNGIGFTGGGEISPSVAGWVYKTANGGNSWTSSPVLSTPFPIRALFTLDTERAWAVGGNVYSNVGGIYGTSDGGASWNLEQNIGNEINDIQSVRVDASTINVFAAGYISQIWRATLAYPADSGLVASSYGFCDTVHAPCSNVYNSGGCTNLGGAGSVLYATGTSSVSADDLVLRATQIPANKTGLFFMGPVQQTSPSGNGLLCIGGGASGLRRFSAHNSGATGEIDQGPGVVAYTLAHFPPASQVQVGSTWNFQCYYRDPTGPCGATYNFSNGFAVTFTP